ncbi:hypothetical protein PSQ19_14280 [Devosia algicola]|uniref:Uncharacterized protein n=1 Tax=Devosia algicola TaxID=3026418 RepID=A0ABY7YLA2_9HYPH|nr:hypothetical protein [Devosia algicola]WDR01870.1 hypothetical protein PSQ19_14280 [Devosia algicola]
MQATAFVVGPQDGPGAALSDMARGLNFASVLPYAGVSTAEQQSMRTPVCYFLFAAVPDIGSLRDVAEAIRFSPSRKVRFSPLIYFASNPSLDTINRCANLGFDDVIAIPVGQDRLAERISRQINKTIVYYETSAYFGPDRRHRQMQTPAGELREGGRYRRLEIMRSLISGISVVRDELRDTP